MTREATARYSSLPVNALPPHRKDPFDRLLIAQARSEQATRVRGDAALQPYVELVTILW